VRQARQAHQAQRASPVKRWRLAHAARQARQPSKCLGNCAPGYTPAKVLHSPYIYAGGCAALSVEVAQRSAQRIVHPSPVYLVPYARCIGTDDDDDGLESVYEVY